MTSFQDAIKALNRAACYRLTMSCKHLAGKTSYRKNEAAIDAYWRAMAEVVMHDCGRGEDHMAICEARSNDRGRIP